MDTSFDLLGDRFVVFDVLFVFVVPVDIGGVVGGIEGVVFAIEGEGLIGKIDAVAKEFRVVALFDRIELVV